MTNATLPALTATARNAAAALASAWDAYFANPSKQTKAALTLARLEEAKAAVAYRAARHLAATGIPTNTLH